MTWYKTRPSPVAAKRTWPIPHDGFRSCRRHRLRTGYPPVEGRCSVTHSCDKAKHSYAPTSVKTAVVAGKGCRLAHRLLSRACAYKHAHALERASHVGLVRAPRLQ
eukprot:6211313-Pleurochrysis_carterae.AAC.2